MIYEISDDLRDLPVKYGWKQQDSTKKSVCHYIQFSCDLCHCRPRKDWNSKRLGYIAQTKMADVERWVSFVSFEICAKNGVVFSLRFWTSLSWPRWKQVSLTVDESHKFGGVLVLSTCFINYKLNWQVFSILTKCTDRMKDLVKWFELFVGSCCYIWNKGLHSYSIS